MLFLKCSTSGDSKLSWLKLNSSTYLKEGLQLLMRLLKNSSKFLITALARAKGLCIKGALFSSANSDRQYTTFLLQLIGDEKNADNLNNKFQSVARRVVKNDTVVSILGIHCINIIKRYY